MTRDHIQRAIEEGIPFVIKMADGEKYAVTNRQQIALGGTYVVIVGEKDLPHVLPLLTMTGLSYLEAGRA